MPVQVRPWTPGTGGAKRWFVDLQATRPDGSRVREKKIDEGPESRARSWGERRLAVITGELHAPKPPEPEPEAARVLTVAEWAEKMSRYYQGAKASARDAALGILATHITPHLGHLPLDRVSHSVVDELEAKWRRGGYRSVRAHQDPRSPASVTGGDICNVAKIPSSYRGTPRAVPAPRATRPRERHPPTGNGNLKATRSSPSCRTTKQLS